MFPYLSKNEVSVFSSDWSHLEKPLALFMDSPDLQWANILENADDGGGVTRGIALIETINRTKKLPSVFPTVEAAIYVLPALIYADGGDEVKKVWGNKLVPFQECTHQ